MPARTGEGRNLVQIGRRFSDLVRTGVDGIRIKEATLVGEVSTCMSLRWQR